MVTQATERNGTHASHSEEALSAAVKALPLIFCSAVTPDAFQELPPVELPVSRAVCRLICACSLCRKRLNELYKHAWEYCDRNQQLCPPRLELVNPYGWERHKDHTTWCFPCHAMVVEMKARWPIH